MKSRRVPPLSWPLSHGAALLAGWAAFTGWGKFHPHPADTQTASSTPEHRPPTPREIQAAAVAQVLAGLAALPDPNDEATRRRTAFQQQVRQEIARMRTAPADLQAQLSAALQIAKKDAEAQGWQPGEGSARVAALLYFQGLDGGDLNQAVNVVDTSPADRAVTEALQAALTELYPVLGPERMFPLLPEYCSGSLVDLIVADQLQSPGLASITRLKSSAGENRWSSILRGLAKECPFSRRDELLALLIREDRPELLPAIPEWNAWVAGLASGATTGTAVPQSFRDRLMKGFSSSSQDFYHPGLPLEIELKNPSATLENIAREQVDSIVEGQSGIDLDYHFRTGQLDAAGVLAQVEKAAPELMARDPQLLRAAVFQRFASLDYARAKSLLDGLPEPQRRTLIQESATHGYSEPAMLLEKLDDIPPRNPEDLGQQRKLWEYFSSAYERNVSGYSGWVQALPPGPNRESALYGLATRSADPALAARLRDLITDPALKEKAALHAP